MYGTSYERSTGTVPNVLGKHSLRGTCKDRIRSAGCGGVERKIACLELSELARTQQKFGGHFVEPCVHWLADVAGLTAACRAGNDNKKLFGSHNIEQAPVTRSTKILAQLPKTPLSDQLLGRIVLKGVIGSSIRHTCRKCAAVRCGSV